MYEDHILRIKLPQQPNVIGNADDIAIVTMDKHLQDVLWACETSMRLIKEWVVSHGLEFAKPNPETVLVSGLKLSEMLKFH